MLDSATPQSWQGESKSTVIGSTSAPIARRGLLLGRLGGCFDLGCQAPVRPDPLARTVALPSSVACSRSTSLVAGSVEESGVESAVSLQPARNQLLTTTQADTKKRLLMLPPSLFLGQLYATLSCPLKRVRLRALSEQPRYASRLL